jgi:tetratricopeptide (TPR) repeat protein
MATPDSDDRVKQGRRLLRDGDFAAAADAFRGIIQDNPDDVPAHEGLGTACFQAGDYAAAVEAFQKVTRLVPKSARGYINLGAVYNRKGDHRQALDALRRALQRERMSSEAYYNMGVAHKGMNQLNLAVTAYREALRYAPDMPEAHLNLANVYRDMNNLQQAELHYEKALEFRPDFARARQGLEHTRQLREEQEQAGSPFGRLVNNSESGDGPTGVSTAALPALSEESREHIYRAAIDSAAVARTLARHLTSEFDETLHALTFAVTQRSEQRPMVADAHEAFRGTLTTLVPLFQDLSDRVKQLRLAVTQPVERNT